MSYESKINKNNSSRAFDNTRLASEICEYYDNSEILKDFFNKALSYADMESEKNRLELCNKIQNDCSKLYILINNLNKMKAKLSKNVMITGSGSDRTRVLIEGVPVETVDGNGFGGVGRYNPSYVTYFGMEFNGLILTKEMLKRDENPFLDKYNQWKNQNNDIEQRIDELSKKIKREEKNFLAIFNKKRHAQKLEQNRIDLGRLQSELVHGINIKEAADKYDMLSDNTKRGIIIYLTLVFDSSNLDMNIKKNMEKVNSGSYLIRTITPEQLSGVIRNAYNDGFLSDEDIENAFAVIKSKEINNIKILVRVFTELFERFVTNNEKEKDKVKVKKDN